MAKEAGSLIDLILILACHWMKRNRSHLYSSLNYFLLFNDYSILKDSYLASQRCRNVWKNFVGFLGKVLCIIIMKWMKWFLKIDSVKIDRKLFQNYPNLRYLWSMKVIFYTTCFVLSAKLQKLFILSCSIHFFTKSFIRTSSSDIILFFTPNKLFEVNHFYHT